MYGINHDEAFNRTNAILGICRRLNIDTVAGPASSGVVIASMCFIRSRSGKRKVNALLLGKKGYRRRKHPPSPKTLGHEKVERILIVDDCAESGDAIIHAIKEIREYFPTALVTGVFCNGMFSYNSIKRLLSCHHKLRFFTHFLLRGVEEIHYNEN